MNTSTKREIAFEISRKYIKGNREQKGKLLEEFCELTGYHRKYAISILGRKCLQKREKKAIKRKKKYSDEVIFYLLKIWDAANYPWSDRLKALLPLWLPWMKKHFPDFPDELIPLLHQMSSRQMDRRLAPFKTHYKRMLYGRTKPGTLLKHHIPISTHAWDVKQPGFLEIDLVSHSGNNGEGHFGYSLNATDIITGWVETQAILGKSQKVVLSAFEAIRERFPFPVLGIDSDNGSEFINAMLFNYCQKEKIAFTRGRPYKKDDNAHIEQKNWTHVRKLLGWNRYDTPEAITAINVLYEGDLRVMMNFFQPTIKLKKKERVGSKLKRVYDQPTTPWERFIKAHGKKSLTGLHKVYQKMMRAWDPFQMSQKIDQKIKRIHEMANKTQSPNIINENQGVKHVA